MNSNIRATAATLLARLQTHRVPLNILLDDQNATLPARDQALLQELCYGVCRWHGLLSALTGRLLEKPLRRRDLDLQCLLLVGLYQVRATRIPDHAAVSETVAAVKQLGKAWARGLVNGVLRRYLSTGEALEAGLDARERSAHPSWLLQQITKDWPQHWEAIVAANNQRAPMTLRCNTLLMPRDQYLQCLAQAGYEALPCLLSPLGIQLAIPTHPGRLPGFDDGLASVQDEGAQFAATLLNPAAGERILDACAAPGGKTCHILETEPTIAELVAVDVDSARMVSVRENLQRCQQSATLIEADITDLDAWWDGSPFDAILADLPCSASGVIRRHPDIKLLRDPEQIGRLADAQAAILDALWAVLRPGGRLVFCTCSIFQAENDASLRRFITEKTDAVAQEIAVDWGWATDLGRQLLPAVNAHDGFYYGLLTKHQSAGNSTAAE